MQENKRIIPGHFFPVPKEIFSLDLCDTEIAIYSYLMFIEDRKTYQAVASYATIGRALKLSNNTVRKCILQLEEKNLICTEHTKVQTRDGRVHNGCLLYTIRPIQDAVEYYTQQQFVRLNAERSTECQAKDGGIQPQAHTGAAVFGFGGGGEVRTAAQILRPGTEPQIAQRGGGGRKQRGRPPPRRSHFCPQCGQFRGFARGVPAPVKRRPRESQNKKTQCFQRKKRGSYAP